MALQKGQRLREVGQFEVAEVGQIKSAGDTVICERTDDDKTLLLASRLVKLPDAPAPVEDA
ncbi:hypothetical protein ACWGY7_14330 [Xanthomonas axonopodis pv. khayae]